MDCFVRKLPDHSLPPLHALMYITEMLFSSCTLMSSAPHFYKSPSPQITVEFNTCSNCACLQYPFPLMLRIKGKLLKLIHTKTTKYQISILNTFRKYEVSTAATI